MFILCNNHFSKDWTVSGSENEKNQRSSMSTPLENSRNTPFPIFEMCEVLFKG